MSLLRLVIFISRKLMLHPEHLTKHRPCTLSITNTRRCAVVTRLLQAPPSAAATRTHRTERSPEVFSAAQHQLPPTPPTTSSLPRTTIRRFARPPPLPHTKPSCAPHELFPRQIRSPILDKPLERSLFASPSPNLRVVAKPSPKVGPRDQL